MTDGMARLSRRLTITGTKALGTVHVEDERFRAAGARREDPVPLPKAERQTLRPPWEIALPRERVPARHDHGGRLAAHLGRRELEDGRRAREVIVEDPRPVRGRPGVDGTELVARVDPDRDLVVQRREVDPPSEVARVSREDDPV